MRSQRKREPRVAIRSRARKDKAKKQGREHGALLLQEITEERLVSVRAAMQQATDGIKATFQAALQKECSLDSLRVQAQYLVGCSRMAALGAFLNHELTIGQASAQSFEFQSELIRLELEDSLIAWRALIAWLTQRQPDKQTELSQKVENIQSLLSALLPKVVVVEEAMTRGETKKAALAIRLVAQLLFEKLRDGNFSQLAWMIKLERHRAWLKLEDGVKDNLMALTEDALECVFHELKYVELWRVFSMRLIQLTRLYVPVLVMQVSQGNVASDAEQSFFSSLFTAPDLEQLALHGIQHSLMDVLRHYQGVCQARDHHQLRDEEAIGPLLQMAEQAFAAPWLRTDAAHHFVMLVTSKISQNLDANASATQTLSQLSEGAGLLSVTPYPQLVEIINEYIESMKIMTTKASQIAVAVFQKQPSIQADVVEEEMKQLIEAVQAGQVARAQAVAGRAISRAGFETTRALAAYNTLLPPGDNQVTRVRICLETCWGEMAQIVDLAKELWSSKERDDAIVALESVVAESKRHMVELQAAQSASAKWRAMCAIHLIRTLHQGLIPVTAFVSQSERYISFFDSTPVMVVRRLLPATDPISCIIQQLLKQQDQAEEILIHTEANALAEKTKIAVQWAINANRAIDSQANIATLLIHLAHLCIPIIFDEAVSPDLPLPHTDNFSTGESQQQGDWYLSSLKSMITQYQAIQARSEPVLSDAAAESMLCYIRTAVDMMAQSRSAYLTAFASLMTWKIGRLLSYLDSSIPVAAPYNQGRGAWLIERVIHPEVKGAEILIKQNQKRLQGIDIHGRLSDEALKAVVQIARWRQSGLFKYFPLSQAGVVVVDLLPPHAVPTPQP